METLGLKVNKQLGSKKGNLRGFMVSASFWFFIYCQGQGEKSQTLESKSLLTELLK